jgi:hypothetical protein
LAAKLEALLKSLGRTEEWRYNRLKKEGKLWKLLLFQTHIINIIK